MDFCRLEPLPRLGCLKNLYGFPGLDWLIFFNQHLNLDISRLLMYMSTDSLYSNLGKSTTHS